MKTFLTIGLTILLCLVLLATIINDESSNKGLEVRLFTSILLIIFTALLTMLVTDYIFI